MSDPLEDSPTPLRRESFAAAQVELCLADILRVLHAFVSPIPEDIEQQLREILEAFQSLRRRQSDTAMRAASQAEIEADNERRLRDQAEVRAAEAEHEKCVLQIRCTHLSNELAELRREIQK